MSRWSCRLCQLSPCSHCLLSRAGRHERGSWENSRGAVGAAGTSTLPTGAAAAAADTLRSCLSGLTRWTQTERSFRGFSVERIYAYRQRWPWPKGYTATHTLSTVSDPSCCRTTLTDRGARGRPSWLICFPHSYLAQPWFSVDTARFFARSSLKGTEPAPGVPW